MGIHWIYLNHGGKAIASSLLVHVLDSFLYLPIQAALIVLLSKRYSPRVRICKQYNTCKEITLLFDKQASFFV